MFQRQQLGISTITPEEVRSRLAKGEDLLIIDVREPMEVAMGKIPGALNIPLSELPERLEAIDRDKEAVLVCRSGNRSHVACQFLQANGYSNVKNMVGGLIRWEGDLE